MASFCKSRIFEASVWRNFKIARRPNFSKCTSSVISSPTSKSGSVFRASDKETCKLLSVTAPSSTISRLRHISKSPFVGFTITSKFSSVPNIFANTLRKDSSSTLIIVVISMFFNSLNSAKVSTMLTGSSFFAILFKSD